MCLYGTVRGILRVVDLFNVVLKFLKTLGFWKTLTVWHPLTKRSLINLLPVF